MSHIYRRPFDHRAPTGFSLALFPVSNVPETVVIGNATISVAANALNAIQAMLIDSAAISAAGKTLTVIGSEVVQIAAATVAVSGRGVSLLARLAVNIKRFFVSLNDING
ncbi:MAG: hypothetical protein GKS00_21975 [Alphaproteobacteria bacterium]|nr:hypothetical protein [Alphaproteobacteria bacterium]